jgi:hypothetical protein
MPLPAELEESSAGRCFYKRGAPNGAFADASFDLGLDFGQACQIILARGESLFVEGFEVDGAEGADVRGELNRKRRESRFRTGISSVTFC